MSSIYTHTYWTLTHIDIFVSIFCRLMLVLAWIAYILSFWYGYLLSASIWLNVKVYFIFILCVCVCYTSVCESVRAISHYMGAISRIGWREMNLETFLNIQIDWVIQSNSTLSEASHMFAYHSNEMKPVCIRTMYTQYATYINTWVYTCLSLYGIHLNMSKLKVE